MTSLVDAPISKTHYKPRKLVGLTGPTEGSTSRSNNGLHCSYCGSTWHSVVSCPKFLQIDVDNRWSWARGNSICFACLQKDQRVVACLKQTKCGKSGCRLPYNQALHGPSPKPAVLTTRSSLVTTPAAESTPSLTVPVTKASTVDAANA